MRSHAHARPISLVLAALLLATVLAPTAQAVTLTNATLLMRWNGAGCIGSVTGTSLSAFADATQDAYDKTVSWPGTLSSTKCTGQTISLSFTNLAKWESVGNIQYVFSARFTDTSGTVSFFTPFNLKLTCSGTNYVHAGGVTCNDPGANNYLQLSNAKPPTPAISNLYQNSPNPESSLFIAWGGVTPMPSDFDWWEVHMSKVQGFTPSYSFPTTLLSKHTWGVQSRAVDNLEPGTQYCFRVRLADRYWEPDNFLTRPHPSFGESAERCAFTKGANLTVTSPNGAEIWSHTHNITWVQGTPSFDVELSSDAGATFTALGSGVGGRNLAWDTSRHADGTQYVVRVRDAASSDVSNATFWLDNTPPVTTLTDLAGAQCNGWFTEPPMATLNATDNLAGVRRTAWRTGSGAWTTYGGPFPVPGEGNLSFQFHSEDRAETSNFEDPANNTVQVRVDLTPPNTTLAVGAPKHQGAKLYVNSTTPFTLRATDAASGVNVTEYRINGGPWLAANGTFRLAGPDGDRTIGYRSTDHACHVEDEHVLDVFLDNTHPVVELVDPASGSITVEDRRLVAPSDLLALLDGILARLPPELQGAARSLRDAAQGAEGPLQPVLRDLCELVRILAPELRARGLGAVADALEGLLCAPLPEPGAAVVAGTVTVRANATDPIVGGDASGMRRVEFFVDGALRASDADAPYEWAWNTTVEQPGKHTLRVLAYDNLEQSTSAEREVVVVPSPAQPPPGVPELPTLLQDLLRFVQDRLPPLPALPTLPPLPA